MSSVAQRKRLIVHVLVTVIVVALAAWIVLPRLAANRAAHAAAERYVGYVASGGEDDLERLWAMTATESPGALRTAGELLVAAAERIEVISVGEPEGGAPPADLPYQVDLDDFVEVEVRYRLDGKEHRWPIVLGKLVGEGGSDVGNWRIVSTMMGSIGWSQPGFTDVASDVYVGSTRQVRRPLLIGAGDEDVQPLYPAVYRTQSRLDPYFASGHGTVAVTAGEPVAPPDLRLEPTRKTRDRILRQVWERFAACGDEDDILGSCPLRDIVERTGVEVWREHDWWRGFTEKPTIEVDREGITVSGGAFRFRGPGGERQVRFSGTGDYLIDNQSWKPALLELDLEEVL